MKDLQTQMKEAVANAAVEQIENGMVLGLGSGSTAALMIEAVGAKLSKGELTKIVGVTTSSPLPTAEGQYQSSYSCRRKLTWSG